MMMAADDKVSRVTQVLMQADYGIFTMISTIVFGLGVYNVFLSRNVRTASISGAILAAGVFLMHSVFDMLFAVRVTVGTPLFPILAVAGGFGGMIAYKIAEKYRSKLGLKDPGRERQELLRQLNQLQDKLSTGSQYAAFLSVDIVGSTRMKAQADPLAVEYTFNEYHEYVARVVKKYLGRIHSTAGDGIICAFENPQDAFAAAKNIQSGLIELNTFRNKIGTPIVVRSGIHSGPVLAPEAGDVTSVNYSRVIDIAAHLQKAAPPGSVAVSEDAATHIIGGLGAVGAERVTAENITAAIWLPGKVVGKSVASMVPPPLPQTKPA
jgi:class 3 adenylate cyclase